MNSLKRTARIVGLLILALVFIAPFGMLIVPVQIIAPGDAVTTANNVRASDGLLPAGIASDALA